MAGSGRAPESDRSRDRRRPTGRDRQTELQPTARNHPAHPLLELQRAAGNAAVQRAIVGVQHSARPGSIQRHVSPATAAMGMSNHANIMLHGAEVAAAAQQLAALGQSINQDSVNTLIHSVQAESYAAPLAGQTGGSGDSDYASSGVGDDPFLSPTLGLPRFGGGPGLL